MVDQGLMVAILGADGSGKSTVIEGVQLNSVGILPAAGSIRIHLFHPILPSPGELRRGKFRPSREQAMTVTDPHGKDAHPLPVASARMIYFVFSAWVSEFAWARHQIAKNMLILNDRHIMELVVDPARYRFNGPIWLARLFGRLAPQPDLVILLEAPTEVLQTRKQEVPPEETERQRRAYIELVQGTKKGHVVNADQPIDDVVRDVNSIIFDFMSARTRKRLKLDHIP